MENWIEPIALVLFIGAWWFFECKKWGKEEGTAIIVVTIVTVLIAMAFVHLWGAIGFLIPAIILGIVVAILNKKGKI